MKHFSLNEFDSPDIESGGENMDQGFLDLLDEARSIADIPFKINSGFRTKEHNEKVGGKPKSSHLRGYAADIACNDSRSRHIIIDSLLSAGFNRIGIAKSFIHVDNDPEKDGDVIWVY